MFRKTNKHIRRFFSFLRNSEVALLLLLEVVFGIATSVGSILLFLKLRGEVLEKDLLPLDMQILHFFYQLRTPFLNHVMIGISYLGGELMVGAAILITIVLLLRRHGREAVLFSFIVVMAGIIDTLLKNLIQRSRPQYFPLVAEKDYSFPSGHSMDSFVFFATLSYLVFHFTKNTQTSLIVFLISSIFVIAIGISRIYLGVHYPTDVLAGYIGGLFWFGSVFLIQKTLVFYKFLREQRKNL